MCFQKSNYYVLRCLFRKYFQVHNLQSWSQKMYLSNIELQMQPLSLLKQPKFIKK